jgi:hypothetical protein
VAAVQVGNCAHGRALPSRTLLSYTPIGYVPVAGVSEAERSRWSPPALGASELALPRGLTRSAAFPPSLTYLTAASKPSRMAMRSPHTYTQHTTGTPLRYLARSLGRLDYMGRGGCSRATWRSTSTGGAASPSRRTSTSMSTARVRTVSSTCSSNPQRLRLKPPGHDRKLKTFVTPPPPSNSTFFVDRHFALAQDGLGFEVVDVQIRAGTKDHPEPDFRSGAFAHPRDFGSGIFFGAHRRSRKGR